MKVYKVELMGSSFIDDKIDDVAENIKTEIENLEIEEEINIKISCLEMTAENFESLPEWEGI